MEAQSGDRNLRQRLWTCQQRREFCDVILQTETGDGVWAHKVILATGSKLLHKLLTRGGPQVGGGGVEVLTLRGVSTQEVGDLVRLLYLQDVEEELSVDMVALVRYYQFNEALISRCETHTRPATQDAVSHQELHKNLMSSEAGCIYPAPYESASPTSRTSRAGGGAPGRRSPSVWPEADSLLQPRLDQRIVVFDEAHGMAVGAILSSGHTQQEHGIEEKTQTCENLIKQKCVKPNDKTGGDIFVDLTTNEEEGGVIVVDLTAEDDSISPAYTFIQATSETDYTTEEYTSQHDGASTQSDEENRCWSPVLLDGVGLDSFDDPVDYYGNDLQQRHDATPEPVKPPLQDSRIIVNSINKENICPKPVKETSPPSRHTCHTNAVKKGRMKRKDTGSYKKATVGIWMGGY